MKKKCFLLLFIVVCFVFAVIPSVFMIGFKSDGVLGNEQQTTMPLIVTKDGSFNHNYMEMLGDYFSTHYAFRPQIMSVDAYIQSKVFSTSNVDSVVVGKDNWLFYSSTLDDYQDKNLMSERAVNNTVHNLQLVHDYLEQMGIEFMFTVAPNKNALYPEYMPYYYPQMGSSKANIENFADKIRDTDVNYCDLFDVLLSESDLLYHEQDSHWNNKGALIAYNAMLDSIDKEHNSFDNTKVTKKMNFYGDLGKMLYPAFQKAEYNYEYDIDQNYTYVNNVQSVEDPIIITENSKSVGKLYMYRDSFSNALLPYLADSYESACFTKTFPINLELDVSTHNSDTVIFEIAQRNLNWFAENPPVIPAKLTGVEEAQSVKSDLSKVSAQISAVNMKYICVSGTVDSGICNANSQFLVVINDQVSSAAYETFMISDDESDYGFCAYIPTEYIASDKIDVSVIVSNDSETVSTNITSINVQNAII